MTYAWFDVTRNAGIARNIHMSYRSKTYTWNDVILVKRSMIRVFFTYYSLRAFVCLSLEEAEAIGIRRVRSFISRLASVIDPHLLHCVCPLNSQFGCNKLCGCG